MMGRPSGFWGKLEQTETGEVVAWHPLEGHCADVGACFEALLDQRVIRERLSRLAGLDDLGPVQRERLAVLACLHDVGKFNLGFQRKGVPGAKDLAGHVDETLRLIANPDWKVTKEFVEAISFDQMSTWGADDCAVCRLLIASIGHHGKPGMPGGTPRSALWSPGEGLDPMHGVAELIRLLRVWYPRAWSSEGGALPALAPFHHAFAGLIMLADWLGSDTRLFPFAGSGSGCVAGQERMAFSREAAERGLHCIGLDARAGRTQLLANPFLFQRSFGFEPLGAQSAVCALPTDGSGSLTILEAETGSGKTEAALARYVQLFAAGAVDGMYFALPTRTAATQIHARVVEAVARTFPDPDSRPAVVQAVPGYLKVDECVGHALPKFEVLWHDVDRERWRFRGWAAEHPKRYLAGAVVVGTVDQVLMSRLAVGHAHLRASALLRHLLVVDEVHASDAYMTTVLGEVLRWHYRAGGHALVMSATLGAAARARLLKAIGRSEEDTLDAAIRRPYPLVSHFAAQRDAVHVAPGSQRHSSVRVELRAAMGDWAAVSALALDSAASGARVIVLRNSVKDCLHTQAALERTADKRSAVELLFSCAGAAAPHHARFSKQDRQSLDQALETSFGRDRADGGCVAATTQTVQQSLDLDADLLITDLCPMDVLLQRVGRLHRHARSSRPRGFEQPTVVVLVPAERDLGGMIGRDGQARGPHGLGTVYDDLRILEATWRVLEANPLLEVPGLSRLLVERTLHPEALDALVQSLGGPWPLHATTVDGRRSAHRCQAGLVMCNWEADLESPEARPANDDLAPRIATRLGAGDRLVHFEGVPPFGPFGAPVTLLTLPSCFAASATAEAAPTRVESRPGELRFEFGDKPFLYDRLGLRPADWVLAPTDSKGEREGVSDYE